MEELTIKDKETKSPEFILGIKEEKYIFVEDGISEEVAAKYELESDMEMKIEKQEVLEDIGDDYSKSNDSNFSYPNDSYAQSSDICEEFKSDCHEDEDRSTTYSYKHFKCVECIYSSNCIDSLKNHILALHCMLFKCNDCEHVSNSKCDLRKHILIVHDNERPFKCSECQFCCKKNSNLKMHIKTVHRKEKTFKCSECDYSCALRSILSKHVRAVHDEERPYKCGDCDKSFATHQHLKRHVTAIHNKEKPFKCCECEKSFDRNYLFADHIRRRVCSEKRDMRALLESLKVGLEASAKQ